MVLQLNLMRFIVENRLSHTAVLTGRTNYTFRSVTKLLNLSLFSTEKIRIYKITAIIQNNLCQILTVVHTPDFRIFKNVSLIGSAVLPWVKAL